MQVSSTIDSDSHRPVFPRKILLIQLARVQDAVDVMEACVASVSHPGLRLHLLKPVEVSKATLRELERLGASVALAQLVDAADALCMLGVGISAIARQCVSSFAFPAQCFFKAAPFPWFEVMLALDRH